VLRHSLPNLKDVGLTCFRGGEHASMLGALHLPPRSTSVFSRPAHWRSMPCCWPWSALEALHAAVRHPTSPHVPPRLRTWVSPDRLSPTCTHPPPPFCPTLDPPADSVYQAITKKAKDAVLKLIEREREGELIDRALVKNILGIFIEVRCAPGLLLPCLGAGWRAGALAEGTPAGGQRHTSWGHWRLLSRRTTSCSLQAWGGYTCSCRR
jgi:hypothetical protein